MSLIHLIVGRAFKTSVVKNLSDNSSDMGLTSDRVISREGNYNLPVFLSELTRTEAPGELYFMGP